MNTNYEWKTTQGTKCPGCGQFEWVNQYDHKQWDCGSRWTNEVKTNFLQSNECQRYELDRLHAKIKELSDSFEAYKKNELNEQPAT